MTDNDVYNTLIALGVPPHLSGFNRLIMAIVEVYKDPSIAKDVTKPDGLYGIIAKEEGVSLTCVEKSLRYAVERCSDRCPVSYSDKVFGSIASPFTGRVKTREFIVAVSNFIRMGGSLV